MIFFYHLTISLKINTFFRISHAITTNILQFYLITSLKILSCNKFRAKYQTECNFLKKKHIANMRNIGKERLLAIAFLLFFHHHSLSLSLTELENFYKGKI